MENKELRALYLKGYMVGDMCTIMLTEAVGSRDKDGVYSVIAAKGDIVSAKIKENSFELTFEFETITVPLTSGKVR